MAIWNERIHEKRKENGITLAQIAEKLGVTEATAQRYERGNIKSIPYEHMCAYGEILHCSPCYLMGWEDKEPQQKSSPQILQYYNQLNDIGKHKATERVKELTEVPRYIQSDTSHYVNAAHPLDGASEEDKQFDEDIMNDENF